MPNWICLLCDNDTPIPHECEIGPEPKPRRKQKSKTCCILVRMGQKRHHIACQHHPLRGQDGD